MGIGDGSIGDEREEGEQNRDRRPTTIALFELSLRHCVGARSCSIW